jgi:hypothetical protein
MKAICLLDDLLTLLCCSLPYVPMTRTPMTSRLSIQQTAVTSKVNGSQCNLRVVLVAKTSLDHQIAMLSLVRVAPSSECRYQVSQKQVGRLAPHIHSFPKLLA